MTTTVWNSALEYVIAAAFEAGICAGNIEVRLSVSLPDGEPNAQKLVADLVKCGARLTRNGDIATVHVNGEHASKLLAQERPSVERCWKCGSSGPFDGHFSGRDLTQKMCVSCFAERRA